MFDRDQETGEDEPRQPQYHLRPRVKQVRKRPLSFDSNTDDFQPLFRGSASPGCSKKAAPLEIQPLQQQVDHSVTFESIGGHSQHIRDLKQMVFHPLLNPEFYSEFNITPPRGVLFCGPPGTGKTLMARALASEASKLSGQKVSFYTRKGADVLSKWMGESEKHLQDLFKQAQINQPSVIFFDEIDGLVPARSSKLEQGNISLVSTLLTLMDGLDSRGNVVVIGATNRVDAIDGALRRPGRFDREFNFTLPACDTRAEMLDIHTREWKHPPSNELKLELAASCVGYSGADLKALCTEAVILAFRDKYPQAYTKTSTHDRFDIDVDSIRVHKHHFVEAMSKIIPAAHRGATLFSRPLSLELVPWLQRHLKKVMENISDIFPLNKCSLRPWLYLYGADGSGLDYLGPAILHELHDKFPVHSLGLASLVSDPNAKTQEEALVHIVGEARRRTPSILYLPDFNLWCWAANRQLRAVLLSSLRDLPSDLPVLLLVTSSDSPAQLDAMTSPILSQCSVYNLVMSDEDLSLFFDNLIKAALEGITKRMSANVQQQSPAGSQDMKMLHGDSTEKVKLLFVRRTKKFTIPQLQRLYADIMKAISDIEDRNSRLDYLFEFAKRKANFKKIICNN